jgi:uncharacterized protein (DUF1697 family)
VSAARRRYAALLRGVMPTNAKMADLRRSFEAAGFEDVKTVLSSGNVVFTGPPRAREALEKKAVAAMAATLGRSFDVHVRTQDELRAILAADPYAGFDLAPEAKRVVTFLRQPPAPGATLPLPFESEGARILCVNGSEVFTAYVPNPRGGLFMAVIEKAFGKDITTRTWDTVRKVAAA